MSVHDTLSLSVGWLAMAHTIQTMPDHHHNVPLSVQVSAINNINAMLAQATSSIRNENDSLLAGKYHIGSEREKNIETRGLVPLCYKDISTRVKMPPRTLLRPFCAFCVLMSSWLEMIPPIITDINSCVLMPKYPAWCLLLSGLTGVGGGRSEEIKKQQMHILEQVMSSPASLAVADNISTWNAI